MHQRREFVRRLAVLGAGGPIAARAWGSEQAEGTVRRDVILPSPEDRGEWLRILVRIADPVLGALAAGRLRATMPVELSTTATIERREYAHLEAVGRLLAGIAPWLELGDERSAEGTQRARLAMLAREGLRHAVDLQSPDFLNFTKGRQPLVDAAFLAHAVVRAPTELWEKLDPTTRRQLAEALRSTRAIQPAISNWLLFSAMVEAALCQMGEQWDRLRVDYAVRQHEQWYKGDGIYGDGPRLHVDYYNSFVIQPMLLDVLRVTSRATDEWKRIETEAVARAKRYAAIQERLVSPEGTFPPVGRSLAYRCGAFQLLGQMALRHELPERVHPAQVRGAMSAVIHRTMDAPGTFDGAGWLTVGFAGHQPSIGEGYICSGSAYLCAVGLLPLGLPAADPFWSAPAEPWTAKALWGGRDLPPDHALD
ncbi:MAG TPA: DUF2264 domain-containing protein [Gemmatimonadaceae bacterium]|jgi:hypothetical protein|nr:DUF2264 domain-containing protein [Gemmatimonadaceae bacterium]